MCTSRGTALLTEREVVLVGEVVYELDQYKNNQFVLNIPMNEYVLYAGGWQYLVTKKIANSKSLQFFLKSIKEFSNNEKMSDIEIAVEP